MKKASSPELLALIEAVDARWDSIPENTFRCAECFDSRFVLRTDEHGRVWGKRCAPCFERDLSESKKKNPDPFSGLSTRRKRTVPPNWVDGGDPFDE